MSNPRFIFVRRLGVGPERSCVSLEACPELMEMADGSFAVIGKDVTESASASLPPGVRCGADERIVVIPRSLVVRARSELPSS